MVLALAALLVAFAGGFGLGRVKNAKKLAAVNAALAQAEGKVGAEAANLINAIKAKL